MKIRILPLIIASYLIIALAKIIDLTNIFEGNIAEINWISELKPKMAMAVENTVETSSNNVENSSNNKDKKESKNDSTDNPEEITKRWQRHSEIFNQKNEKVSFEKPAQTVDLNSECSNIDVNLMQTLSKRREELDRWTKEAETKENVLLATNMKIDQKLKELKQLKSEITELLSAYNEKENLKIRSLVKIYESMKPKDAATIFEQLDMNILLQVIDQMKESKVATILANMNPTRAKEITTEYLEQKKIPSTTQKNS